MTRTISKIRYLTLISTLFISSALYADSFSVVQNYFSQVTWHPVMTVTSGVAFSSNVAKTINIPAHDGVFSFFNYSATGGNDDRQPLFGAFLGEEFSLQQAMSLQAGLAYYEMDDFIARGNVVQGVDIPSSNSYGYQYQIESQQVLAEGKLLYNWQCYHPYFSLGLGASFNDAQDFNVNIQPPFTTFSNQFNNNTSTYFSYSVGLGVDVDVLEHLRLGIGYRFADLGKAKTGIALIDNVVTTNTLSTTRIYANEIQAQLTVDL